ncbi:MAG: phosphatase PAP2 family protein [Caldimonas sp.]
MVDPITPPARLGLQLATGALALIAAAWLFGAIAEDVVTGDRLTVVDVELARWLHERATPALTRWVLVVTNLHSTIAISCYGAVLALLFAFRRHWRRVVALLVCLAGGLALNVLMKLAFHRARPVFDHPLLTLSSYSFPSGHVAGATIFYGLGVVFVFMQTRRWRPRIAALVVAGLAITVVAFSRTYLGVHYLSDVAAAFAEGVAWLAVSLTALDAYWRRRDRAR